jgi:hypothetical protein
MSKLQYENHRERFYDRPVTLHGLSIYKRSLYDCKEKNIEYFSSQTFFDKMSSLLRKLARSKSRSSSYSLYIYPITPHYSICFSINNDKLDYIQVIINLSFFYSSFICLENLFQIMKWWIKWIIEYIFFNFICFQKMFQ